VDVTKRLFALVAVLPAILLPASPALAQRLPGGVIPEHYTLWFAPDLRAHTFRSRETLRVQVSAATSRITLNAAELDFGAVTITAAGHTQKARVDTDARAEMATFVVSEPIPAGPATIDVQFTGTLNDKLRGFYFSQGPARGYAVTQFEATDARRAFPNFDEPAYKATFDIALMIDRGDIAISNGRVTSDVPGPDAGKHTVTFSTTPKISSYLVAMLVGDFVCREGKADAIAVRVCSTPDKQALTGFALDAAEQQLTFYNNYFGIKYPFEKLDIIGIPDFSAGAMENAGAITFRERSLLVDPERSSLGARRRVATVTAHEIAHQWFGDLVTMKWWDDIWLNEGFANWMEKKPVAAWKPEWHIEFEEAQDTQSALAVDAMANTRAIRTAAETPDQINELFDSIAYDKTASLLRMIEKYVGPDAFRAGVSSYLRKYSFGNATGEDFWNEMTRVTGKPIDVMMRTFVEQPGAPVLSIATACNAGTTEITVRQQRFTAAAPAPSGSQSWTFPACFKTTDGTPRCEIVDRREQTFTAPGCNNVFANAESRGYYFSEYSSGAVRALTESATGLTPVERISLAGDEWWMVQASRHDIDGFLDLTNTLIRDDTAAVLDAVAAKVTYIVDRLADPRDRPRYQAWIRERVGPALRQLGLPGDANDDPNLQGRRATLLSLVGMTADDTEVQRLARDLALRYIADPTSVPPTLASTILNVAALGGDQELYDKYLAKLRQAKQEPEVYYQFFNALPYFRQPALVRRTLELSLSQEIRSQDSATLVGGLMEVPWGDTAAWSFVEGRWDALTAKLETFQGIPRMIRSMSTFCSAERAADMKRFFMQHPVPSSERTIQQQIERVESCAALKSRQGQKLGAWIAAR
jgi:aminopeptidase N